MDRIEKIFKKYDLADDRGKGYEDYYKEIFERYYEPNCFECE